MVAISHSQRATAPSAPVAAVIHHGIAGQRSAFGSGAAKMWQPEEHRDFEECVRPQLGTDAVYVGEVGAARKYELLVAGAEALVNPIGWPELDHGRTGFRA